MDKITGCIIIFIFYCFISRVIAFYCGWKSERLTFDSLILLALFSIGVIEFV